MRNANQPVVQEGYPFIGLFAFITLIFALLGWGFMALLLLALTLFTIYFFRNPERVTPQGDDLVVAPADGEVIFVGEVEEGRYCEGPVQKISIFMSVFNVHVNRVPLSGQVVDMFYRRGEFFNASLDKASEQNEQGGILLEDAKGRRILFVQIAGLIARRIVTYPVVGDLLQVSQRYGLIRFGSRVDVYLPLSCEIEVGLGDKTIAGESIIGRLHDN